MSHNLSDGVVGDLTEYMIINESVKIFFIVCAYLIFYFENEYKEYAPQV
jgi:hypothetical protein